MGARARVPRNDGQRTRKTRGRISDGASPRVANVSDPEDKQRDANVEGAKNDRKGCKGYATKDKTDVFLWQHRNYVLRS